MGMPFPIGISLIEDSDRKLIAFSWAFNGFFSVIGSVLAMIFAMTLGFKFVFVFSAVVYIIAMLFVSKKLIKN